MVRAGVETACLEMTATALEVRAAAIRAAAHVPGSIEALTFILDVRNAWMLWKISRLLATVEAFEQIADCSACAKLQGCEPASGLIQTLRESLRSIDDVLTQMNEGKYSGPLTRWASRGVAGRAGEISERLEDLRLIQSGSLGQLLSQADDDLAPEEEYFSTRNRH